MAFFISNPGESKRRWTVFCPACRSKRFKGYRRRDDEFFCPACKMGFRIENFDVPSCYKCGRLLDDYSKAVLMGSGKARHERCRKYKKKETTIKREGGIKTC